MIRNKDIHNFLGEIYDTVSKGITKLFAQGEQTYHRIEEFHTEQDDFNKDVANNIEILHEKVNVMSDNVVNTYRDHEDVFLLLKELNSRIDKLEKGVELFLANFSIVEDIPVDTNQAERMTTAKGTTIENLVKTVDSVTSYDSLTDIGRNILEKPDIKIRYADPKQPRDDS